MQVWFTWQKSSFLCEKNIQGCISKLPEKYTKVPYPKISLEHFGKNVPIGTFLLKCSKNILGYRILIQSSVRLLDIPGTSFSVGRPHKGNPKVWLLIKICLPFSYRPVLVFLLNSILKFSCIPVSILVGVEIATTIAGQEVEVFLFRIFFLISLIVSSWQS